MKNFILSVLISIGVLVVSLSIYKSQDLKRAYNKEVLVNLAKTKSVENSILTKDDIKHLPEAVQKYLIYTGALGQEQVSNMRVVTEGQFKTDLKENGQKFLLLNTIFYRTY